ncbi:hypothetical protein GALMADRAFT_232294 [Galerina marginata CBS 339.88]|uniref:Uncharacterized protein n=1 Tax=Galerina marginata (strain CBS 339.88) TaxID=685588 RepID=A0A067SJF5_GALM3|nr:hypothetical protein GALMADRAFT_232294 [Galerina marginata CBS 339.88]
MSQCMISELASLILTSVGTLEKVCRENKFPIPDLNAPGFSPESEAFRSNSAAAEAAKLAAAACMQLAAALLPPTDAMYGLVVGDHHSAAVRVCLEANVTEILREGGPDGLHVNDIAAKCGLDPSKLGRIMRYLANYHVYRELKPDIFTNNRVSGTLDTGKSCKDISTDPESKYDSTGFPALVSHHLDLNHKCSAVAWDVLRDPILGHSKDLTNTVFSRGLSTDMTFWQFFGHPDNYLRHRRMGFAIQGIAAVQPIDMIFKAFNWEALPKYSLVVDVGGGLGVSIMPVARKYGDLNIVIQDQQKVVEAGKRLWLDKFPEALDDGRVKLEAHDFFSPQCAKNASVFLVKHVLHNWPKPYMTKILHQLREAATKDTVLIIIDNVLPYACRSDPEGFVYTDSGVKEAPEPLLPNYGAVGNAAYTLDMTMMFNFNAEGHTVLGLKALLAETGWRMSRIHAIDPKNFFLQSVEASPM